MTERTNQTTTAMGTNRIEPKWLDPNRILESGLEFIRNNYPFEWIGIYILEGEELILGPYLGASTDHTRIPIGRGICGQAVALNKDLNIPDVRLESNYLACSLETRSELVVLIHSQNQIVGQIDIDSHQFNAFDEASESLVKHVALVLGEKWELKKRYL